MQMQLSLMLHPQIYLLCPQLRSRSLSSSSTLASVVDSGSSFLIAGFWLAEAAAGEEALVLLASSTLARMSFKSSGSEGSALAAGFSTLVTTGLLSTGISAL